MEINITTSTVELNDSQFGFDKIEVCKNFNSEKNSNEPILEKKKKTSRFKKILIFILQAYSFLCD
ncbi:hypothetical protein A0H76_1766 [Hepatospora eriocheir]|uniref:Uncharacterized protein n=1 Tax=Hepatospora eriocheir TaxID=1081669 RepID=A0A1X0Q5M0_9MICR|nr:hypothetical protein A0H76_1766 [Hepatospora eriocheir]